MTPKFSPGDKIVVKACYEDARKVGMAGEIIWRIKGENRYWIRLDGFGLMSFEPRDLDNAKETTT
jgi:hypothetical protein